MSHFSVNDISDFTIHEYGDRFCDIIIFTSCKNGNKHEIDNIFPSNFITHKYKHKIYKGINKLGDICYFYEIINTVSNKRYFQFHREDGPAVELSVGTKFWYRHGYLHNNHGPAIKYNDGYKVWFLYGQRESFFTWLIKRNFFSK